MQRSGKVPGTGLVHAPFALLPMSFPKVYWRQACELAPIFNELVDRVSLDGTFLQESLSRFFSQCLFERKPLHLLWITVCKFCYLLWITVYKFCFFYILTHTWLHIYCCMVRRFYFSCYHHFFFKDSYDFSFETECHRHICSSILLTLKCFEYSICACCFRCFTVVWNYTVFSLCVQINKGFELDRWDLSIFLGWYTYHMLLFVRDANTWLTL